MSSSRTASDTPKYAYLLVSNGYQVLYYTGTKYCICGVAGLSAERGSPPHYRLSSHNRQANGAAHTTVTPLARRTQQRPERSAPWPTRPKDRARPPPRPNALRRAQQQRGKTTKPTITDPGEQEPRSSANMGPPAKTSRKRPVEHPRNQH